MKSELRKIIVAAGMLALLSASPTSKAQPVNIALSQVGNPGNAADPSSGNGSVS